MLKILIVGLDDIARTPMFKAVLQKMMDGSGQNAKVESCGISRKAEDGLPMDGMAAQCLGQAELAMPDHRSRSWRSLDPQLNTFDYIICMDRTTMDVVGMKIEGLNDQREGVLPPIQVRLANEEGGGIKPPTRLGSYAACLQFISVIVRNMVGQLDPMVELPKETE